jgi:hypothetical protein
VQKPPVAPPTTEKLVCLEFLGNPSTAAELEQLETEVRSILNGLNVDIFAPSTLGQVPRDPAGTDRYLQRLIKAKAQCDGLLVVRVDRTTSLADWRLDYVSDIRPAALRLRSDGTVPRPLIVDTSSPHADPVSEDIRSLRYDQPDFTAHLAKWVDSLPVAPRGAA